MIKLRQLSQQPAGLCADIFGWISPLPRPSAPANKSRAGASFLIVRALGRIGRRARTWNDALARKLVGSIHDIEVIFMSREKPNDDPREQTDPESFRKNGSPWEQPVEKEQNPKGVRKSDLEKWQRSNTH
jgi:hypothetical protein